MASPHRFSARYPCGIAALAFLVAAPLLAQSQGRGEGSPRYDVATESTVTGTVESVEQITAPGGGRGRRGLGGTHITLKTSAETLEVHLGPTSFLNEKKVAIAKGDTLVVVGSRVAVDGERVFIAKEVKKGDSVWTLRDAAGFADVARAWRTAVSTARGLGRSAEGLWSFGLTSPAGGLDRSHAPQLGEQSLAYRRVRTFAPASRSPMG